jgi:leucyl aminopeptidase (aminopeptidase T)
MSEERDHKKLLHSARTALHQCMALKARESLLIVANPETLAIAQVLWQAGAELTDDLRMLVYPAAEMNGIEPPDWVAAAMMDADVIMAPTLMSISHTQARRRASKERKARIASMPGITKEIFIRGLASDYDEIEARSIRLKAFFDQAQTARVTSPSGTDIHLILGNPGAVSAGKMTQPGDFTNLPDGETETAPVSANGVLVVDRCGDYITEPTKLHFKDGYLVDYQENESGQRFKALVERAKELDGNHNAAFIAEFAIGTNPTAEVSGVVLEDEKVLGTCHIAVGDNTSYVGGNNPSTLHIDMIVFKPTIFFDDQLIMQDGILKV